MLIGEPLPFIKDFVEKVNEEIKKHKPENVLSRLQMYWIGFCIVGIFMTNTVCWAKYERASLGRYTVSALSWMFRHSGIDWGILLYSSLKYIFQKYGITEGVLAIDDTEKQRSKNTKKIPKVHKLKDKKTGGYFMGQCIVFLVLITSKATIPVGFMLYMPDPEVTKWNKLKEQNKKSGKKIKLPKKPPKNPDYPTKQAIALKLLQRFAFDFPAIKIKCILADNLYCSGVFLNKASNIFEDTNNPSKKTQVISQLRKNQNIRYRNKDRFVEKYFSSYPGICREIKIRGEQELTAYVGSARLYVCSHKKKRFVIALKYEGEQDYRYLVASDMSWRTEDIVHAYTLRWLIEVFIQDWKSYEGWRTLTKQRGEEGTTRSLILSLLADLCLLVHPEQLARFKNNLPAITVGSLIEKSKAQCLFSFIEQLVLSEDSEDKFNKLRESLNDIFRLSDSKKHMVNRQLGRLEPTPALKYKNL